MLINQAMPMKPNNSGNYGPPCNSA